ncbi:MAG: hypothetical protein EOP06_07820, partial [Proteobacteria bacterium]
MSNFSPFVRLSAFLLLSALSFQTEAASNVRNCQSLFANPVETDNHRAGAIFLRSRDSNIHSSKRISRVSDRTEKLTGSRITKPIERIGAWLEHSRRLLESASGNARAIESLKNLARKNFVIRGDEIPQEYYDLQVELARDRGHGTITLTESMKSQLRDQVIEDQIHSLNIWVDYLLSSEAAAYPVWARYWILSGMTKLSKFQPESSSFGTRSKQTVAPFPELNGEALAYVVDGLLKQIDSRNTVALGDRDLEKLVAVGNFGKLYAYALLKAGSGPGIFRTNQGQWVRFEKGSDHRALVKSLQGRNTGWCTAGETTAETQLAGGDFHVFYSFDADDRPSVPRIAIRMEGSEIGEVRGVATKQNLDDQIADSDVLARKLEEFGDRAKLFAKRESDMKTLTMVARKSKLGTPLSNDELRFLYEIDRKINGFGHATDPRISEIRSARHPLRDINTVFSTNYTKGEVSFSKAFTRKSLESGRVKVRFGDIKYNHDSVVGITLPSFLRGTLNLPLVKSAVGLKLPSDFQGTLTMQSLESARGLKLPSNFIGDLILDSVTSGLNLNLPSKFEGTLSLHSLENASALALPRDFSGNLFLQGLKSAAGLVLPEKFQGHLSLTSLTTAHGLKIP